MTFLGFDNAIAWAHFQLRGGWRKTLTIAGFVAAAAIVLIMMSTRLDPARTAGALVTWTTILMGAFSCILIFAIPSRIGAAINNDLTVGMIDSHRLMPISPASAVAGYYWGGAGQMLVLAGTIFVIGAATATAAGMTLDRWIVPAFITIEFSLLAAIIAMFVSMLGGAVSGAIVALSFVGFWIGIQTGMLLPGLVLLVTPLLHDSIFAWRTKSVEISWPVAASMFSHVIFGGILFVGTVRRYRRSDQPALGVIPALGLLAAWVCVSIVGVNFWEEFRPAFLRGRTAPQVQMLGSLIAAMLLAVVPLTNAARGAASFSSPIPAAFVASAFMLALPLASPFEGVSMRTAAVQTAIVLLAHCISVIGVQGLSPPRQKRSWMLMLWFFLIWAVPVLMDLGQAQLNRAHPAMTGRSSFSPAGALINIWYSEGVDVTKGLWFQSILAAGLLVAYLLKRKRDSATDGGRAHEG